MIAGFSNVQGYGNTPVGGIKGFYSLFTSGRDLDFNSFEGIDALILWGGSDIGTELYGQPCYLGAQHSNNYASQRDLFEWHLMKEAKRRKIPIIGVCRGAQIMCAFAGGKLVQDVQGHHTAHEILTVNGEIFKNISSSHHQMLYPFDVPHEILAVTTDNLSSTYKGLTDKEIETIKEKGEPEVVYFPDINGIGIQCHPEWHEHGGDGQKFNDWIQLEILTRLFGDSQ